MLRDDSARCELRRELHRIVLMLGRHLARERQGGREPAGDMLRGMAIDEGEAEGLVAALAVDLAQPLPVRFDPDPPPARREPGPPARETPLAHAVRVFRLGPLEYDALLLALAVELDPRCARLVAYLNDHVARPRPTLGLVLAVNGAAANAIELAERPAIRCGLLQLDGDGPLSVRALAVAPDMLPRLAAPGVPEKLPQGVRLRREGPPLDALVGDRAAHLILRRWAASWQEGSPAPALVLCGPPGSGRATAALAASAVGGRGLIEVGWPLDGATRAAGLGVAVREAMWHDAALLVRVDANASDGDIAALWSLLAAWDLPLVLAVPPALAERVCADAPVEPALLRLGDISIEQREALWQRILDEAGAGVRAGLSDAERRELAARYDFQPGALARAVRRALAERRFGGDDRPLDFESLSRACRDVGSAGIGPIAQRLPLPYTREDLVLPAELLAELDLASAWMRHRRLVFEQWGFARRIMLGQGLTALFAGEPGTGKTMAAQVLARELGLELFRVDLSRVMSKYIGETEKNLSQLFDSARGSGAMLFFDEADVLFGKRTEVKDAHDRYANLEIGYLLQRIEEHTGTTVLATNRLGDLDEAFTRRFHFILDFPMPRPPERLRIWQGMLPRDAEIEAGLALDRLARDYEITGGEIRNSVLSAAFMAADEGKPIGLRHLQRGLRRELLKTGRVLDTKQRRALEGIDGS